MTFSDWGVKIAIFRNYGAGYGVGYGVGHGVGHFCYSHPDRDNHLRQALFSSVWKQILQLGINKNNH